MAIFNDSSTNDTGVSKRVNNTVVGTPMDIQGFVSDPIVEATNKTSTNGRAPSNPSQPVRSIEASHAQLASDLVDSTNKMGAKIAGATEKQTEFLIQQEKRENRSKLSIASARFALDIQNANSAYGALESSAQFRILEARRSAQDSIERGKQRQLEEEGEGVEAGQEALLSLAAQGQDVQGSNAQKVQGSLEDIGLYNGLQQEIDSVKEALGFDLEEIAINYQVDQGEIQRNSTILSSALNLGATAYSSTL